jgi:hypothetical protein
MARLIMGGSAELLRTVARSRSRPRPSEQIFKRSAAWDSDNRNRGGAILRFRADRNQLAFRSLSAIFPHHSNTPKWTNYMSLISPPPRLSGEEGTTKTHSSPVKVSQAVPGSAASCHLARPAPMFSIAPLRCSRLTIDPTCSRIAARKMPSAASKPLAAMTRPAFHPCSAVRSLRF